MLSLVESKSDRRGFLRVGALGGLALSDLLRVQALGAEQGSPLTGKSVVFVFMHGGPSQIETFDPRMTAPVEIRSTTGEVQTTVPGVTFGGTFPQLARLADRMSIVRSFTTGNGNHDIKPIVSAASVNANIGSVYASVAGSNDPQTGMPTNAALFPRCVEPDSQPRIKNFGDFLATGSLGAASAPFIPGGGGQLQSDMQLRIPRARLDDRRELLRRLDRLRRDADASGALSAVDRFREQAFETILGGVGDAFDLKQEDAATLRRYDTAPLVRPENIDKKWNNRKYYIDNAATLGRLMLLARRLVERGCGFVTVTTNFVWDMHADQNNAGMREGMGYVGAPFDHAISAFLEDIEHRGLSDRVALVCCGEMGRTPRINKNGGRDHWGAIAPLMLAGGGFSRGQVIGQSTRHAAEPASEPWKNTNLVATLMNLLFDVGRLRVTRGVPREVMDLMSHPPIAGLL